MQKPVSTFVAVNLVAAVALGAAVYFLGPSLEDKAGYLAMPMVVIPFVMAYICNRMEGNPKGPFAGLTWGNTSWYFSAWALALVAGLAALFLSLGLGLMGLDPAMGDYMASVQDMMKEQGQELPESALGIMKVTYQITSFSLPTIAVPFSAAVLCLSTLPWLGWFGRRLLAGGRSRMLTGLALMYLVTSTMGAFVPIPAFSGGELPLSQRLVVSMLGGISALLATVWIFLRTRSAVLPAIAAATWQGTLGLATFYGSDVNHFLSAPSGIIPSAVAICAGIALWVWKEPGGEGMAIQAAAPGPPAPVSTGMVP